MTHHAIGVHCILEVKGCPFDVLDDEARLRELLQSASDKALSTLLSINSHKFEPHGVTAVAVLAESHISIHTWPELGYAAVDIFTCGETARPRIACDFMIRELRASDHTLKVIPRGDSEHYFHPAVSECRQEVESCRVLK